MCCGDSVNEDRLLLLNACCCCNTALYPSLCALGCSGKAGVFCCNLEICCSLGASPMIPCGCCGCRPECSIWPRGQLHVCCCVESCAWPCGSDDVPLACGLLGLTCYPKLGCCLSVKSIKEKDKDKDGPTVTKDDGGGPAAKSETMDRL